jgi:hypothetical protein
MFYNSSACLFHHITSPATDISSCIQLFDLFDKVASMQVSGGFASYDVVLH